MSNSRKLAVAMDAAEATQKMQFVYIAGYEVAIQVVGGLMCFWVDGVPAVSRYVFGLCE